MAVFDINQPLISVIICNYNYGKFIAQSIESVLNQTYTNFELIIVDDGSSDNSREIISTYQDYRLKTIYKNNEGQASAFNEGFLIANGEIISFLDSDDWWKPEKLQTIIDWHNFLQGNYAVLQHGLDIWLEGKTRPYKFTFPVGDCFAEMKSSKKFDFFIPTSGLSFPKKILDKIFPIPLQLWICADAYIMRTAFIDGLVYSIPRSLGFYRQHNNATFLNKNFKHEEFFKTVLFPALNDFYECHNIKYKMKLSLLKSTNHSRRLDFLKKLFKKLV